ncbi:A disintegrin and metalloproteinase with thrombospondin motifs 12-like [Ochotona princeps]|uniref:A disintegrin and metalloproteinase with thrombospondin motifs 12-like n=1 Tax=Ochotona princeps TaxID=9978 RepID=UPI0027147BF2|nr:A disintegrin and metalloproteinase with thrombospondin motifs 12-like [Ochotona princeps]
MPCARRSWLTRLSAAAQLFSFVALCLGRHLQPGLLGFPDRRQARFLEGLPEYHVVGPVQVDASGHFLSYDLHHPTTGGRRKRDLDDSDDRVYYRISHEEKDLFFNLTVHKEFLSNNYIVEKRYGNLSHVQIVAPVGPRCHLRGTIVQQGTTVGTAALSACHGLELHIYVVQNSGLPEIRGYTIQETNSDAKEALQVASLIFKVFVSDHNMFPVILF